MLIDAHAIPHIALWSILQQSISSYHKLLAHFKSAEAALHANALGEWQQLKLHGNHLQRFTEFQRPAAQAAFDTLLKRIEQHCDHLLLTDTANYPSCLSHFADRPPLLFIRGQLDSLYAAQIAMVGSRHSSSHGAQHAYDFAYYLSEKKLVICSGLAIGIDSAAHRGGIAIGRSNAVIATGLEQCYPKDNQALWDQILAQDGCIISEFLPNTPASKHNFPRRNRLISGLSLATVVVEAGLQSGSLITAQYAAEQGKQVFAIPGHIYSPSHLGCHQLIREGATLVDHPQQILDDLCMFGDPLNSMQTSENPQQTASHLPKRQTIEPPEHLQALWQQLDWIGLSIDELALRLNHDIATLSTQLVELELLGLCTQHAGRYLRSSL